MRFWLPLLWLAGFALVGLLSAAPTFAPPSEPAFGMHDAYRVLTPAPVAVALGVPFLFFAAVYAFFQRFVGVPYSLRLSILHLSLSVVGAVMIKLPPIAISFWIPSGAILDQPEVYRTWNTVSNVGSALILLSGLVFLAVLFEALRRRRRR